MAAKATADCDPTTVGELAVPAAPVQPDVPCLAIEARMRADPTLSSVVIRRSGGDMELLSRSRLARELTGPHGFGRALYERRGVGDIAPGQPPLVLEAATTAARASEAMLARASECRYEDALVHWPDGRVATLAVSAVMEHLAGAYAHRALHDPLTDLANRILFADRVEHALTRSRRETTLVGVLFIDLDDFKLVNDTLGHHCGDQVLVEVGRRLAASVRPGDTAARLGGDEFAVLVEGLSGPAEAQEVGRRLVEQLHERFVIEGTEVVVTATVGIAVAASGTATDSVLQEADLAMYEAKRQGKDRAELFAEDMRSPALHRRSLKADISRGLERGEFVTHYQPIVDLETGRFVAVEALVRWHHPERGLLGPDEFISVAEDTGLVVPIGLEVLHRAVEQTQEWNQRYNLDPPLRVSVNLSGRQVQAHGLVRAVARALDGAGMEPEQLTLEITESVLLEDAGPAGDALGDLKALGVALSLDDFGTGYSSLGYLQRFPIDELKLDRMFVRGLGSSSHDTRLAGAIIAMGHMLGLQVVAEGIEGPEQLETLRRLGCRRGQGYLFAPPLPAAALQGLLATVAAGPLPGENPGGVGVVTTSR